MLKLGECNGYLLGEAENNLISAESAEDLKNYKPDEQEKFDIGFSGLISKHTMKPLIEFTDVHERGIEEFYTNLAYIPYVPDVYIAKKVDHGYQLIARSDQVYQLKTFIENLKIDCSVLLKGLGSYCSAETVR